MTATDDAEKLRDLAQLVLLAAGMLEEDAVNLQQNSARCQEIARILRRIKDGLEELSFGAALRHG